MRRVITKPNKANIRKWVKALRSGRYKQAQSVLRSLDTSTTDGAVHKFCCLGVACEISGCGKWVSASTYKAGKSRSNSGLPKPVQRWLGIPLSNPELGFGHTAIGMNDQYGYGFKRIATAIEKTYLRPRKKHA